MPKCVCLRGSAPVPAGGLTAPPTPQLEKVGSHTKLDHPVEKSFPRHCLSVNWSKLSIADKDTYARDIDVHLNAVKVPVDAMCCKDTECSNEQHLEALDVFYEGLVGVLTEANKKLANRT